MLRCMELQSFGEHGRELITPEVGLRLLEMLVALGSEMDRTPNDMTQQQKLLKRTVFKVVVEQRCMYDVILHHAVMHSRLFIKQQQQQLLQHTVSQQMVW